MKRYHGINILLFATIWYLGFYFLKWDNQLLEDFFRVGWDKYEGLSLRYPENTYFKLFIAASAYSFWVGVQTVQKYGVKRVGILLAIVGGCSFLFAGVSWLADGDFSMKETTYFWQFFSAMNIILSVIAFAQKEKGEITYLNHSDILDDPNSIINEDI